MADIYLEMLLAFYFNFEIYYSWDEINTNLLNTQGSNYGYVKFELFGNYCCYALYVCGRLALVRTAFWECVDECDRDE